MTMIAMANRVTVTSSRMMPIADLKRPESSSSPIRWLMKPRISSRPQIAA
jgi:hypothetical protein